VALYNYIESTGTVVPDTSDLLTDVEDEYKSIFGEDFITDPSTPEGALISAETTSRASVVNNNAELANQINPNISGGVFLDAIYALTGGERDAGTPSLVDVDITGVASTAIPSGSQARTTDGDLFESVSNLVIGVGGTVSGQFQSVELGAIGAGSNTLTIIVDNIIGWETITNPLAATPGSAEQSDASVRTTRRTELALQGRSISEAIFSNVSAVDGVTSLALRENTTNAPDTIDGILIDAHSVWTAVRGGTDEDVANALYEAKSGGAGWTGGTTVVVTDQISGQDNDVMFDRPAEIPMFVRITVQVIGATGIDPTTAVKQSIVDYANGDIDGEQGFVVGGDVSPFELAGAVNIQNPEIFVRLCEISDDDITYVTSTFAIALDEIATIDENDIAVILA
jgi:hypothetical protein